MFVASDVAWADVLRVVLPVLAILSAFYRWASKLLGEVRGIRTSVSRIGGIETKVNSVEASVTALKADVASRHQENTAAIGELSTHMANQETTARILVAALGEPMQSIARVLERHFSPPPEGV